MMCNTWTSGSHDFRSCGSNGMKLRHGNSLTEIDGLEYPNPTGY